MSLPRPLSVLAPPSCWSCGSGCRWDEPLCRACRRQLRWLSHEPVELEGLPTWAPVSYQGPARDLVRALKFHGAVAVADAMAAQIVASAPRGLLEGAALVPVPLHPSHQRRRGFNQAERLAAAVGRRVSVERTPCLGRRGRSTTQAGRDKAQRRSAALGAIVASTRVAVPRRAVLVDDVITTGATLIACARALREGGAQSVAAVGYARTPGR